MPFKEVYMPKFRNLIIKEITKETQKAISILFEVPNDLKEYYAFIPGQYITIRINIDGKEIRRSYSICSSPESSELRVAIKEVENGLFSNYATKTLKAGKSLGVAPPEGKFILQTATSHQRNYLAFAAGSGITPVMSMIKSVLEKEIHSTFVLVYGNKSAEETIFKSEIDNLQAKYPARFSVHHVFSKKILDNAIFGRIDKAVVNLIVKNKFKNTPFHGYYLCGPENMIDTVTQSLKENGVEASKIHFELFTTIYPAGLNNTNELEGITEVTVLLDDEETTFEMSKKKLILTACLDEDLDAPYSCQGGICSSCIAKITEGTVVMDNNSILTDQEIEDGFILTCQAHPTSQKISIDYDEV